MAPELKHYRNLEAAALSAPQLVQATYLISLLIASSCSWSIMARVWASEWPLGDSRSMELNSVSLSSSSMSDISVSLSNGWLLRTPICCVLFHSWSPRDFTWAGIKTPMGYDRENWKAELQKKWERKATNTSKYLFSYKCSFNARSITANCIKYFHIIVIWVSNYYKENLYKKTLWKDK